MKFPGFTAESSLGKPSKVYWSHPHAIGLGRSMPGIVAAQAEVAYAGAEMMDDEAEEFGAESAEVYDEDESTGEQEGADEWGDDVGQDAGDNGEPEGGDVEDGEVDEGEAVEG